MPWFITFNATFIIIIIVVNCGVPEISKAANDSDPDIEGYDGLPIEGSTIRLICPPGLELIGGTSSITARCNESGKWDPEPSGLICNGK